MSYFEPSGFYSQTSISKSFGPATLSGGHMRIARLSMKTPEARKLIAATKSKDKIQIARRVGAVKKSASDTLIEKAREDKRIGTQIGTAGQLAGGAGAAGAAGWAAQKLSNKGMNPITSFKSETHNGKNMIRMTSDMKKLKAFKNPAMLAGAGLATYGAGSTVRRLSRGNDLVTKASNEDRLQEIKGLKSYHRSKSDDGARAVAGGVTLASMSSVPLVFPATQHTKDNARYMRQGVGFAARKAATGNFSDAKKAMNLVGQIGTNVPSASRRNLALTGVGAGAALYAAGARKERKHKTLANKYRSEERALKRSMTVSKAEPQFGSWKTIKQREDERRNAKRRAGLSAAIAAPAAAYSVPAKDQITRSMVNATRSALGGAAVSAGTGNMTGLKNSLKLARHFSSVNPSVAVRAVAPAVAIGAAGSYATNRGIMRYHTNRISTRRKENNTRNVSKSDAGSNTAMAGGAGVAAYGGNRAVKARNAMKPIKVAGGLLEPPKATGIGPVATKANRFARAIKSPAGVVAAGTGIAATGYAMRNRGVSKADYNPRRFDPEKSRKKLLGTAQGVAGLGGAGLVGAGINDSFGKKIISTKPGAVVLNTKNAKNPALLIGGGGAALLSSAGINRYRKNNGRTYKPIR